MKINKSYIIFMTIIAIIAFSSYFTNILIIPFLIIGTIGVFVLICGGLNAINNCNEGKEGYYAEYGISYGANADKHNEYIKRKQRQYLEEQIANNIMGGE